MKQGLAKWMPSRLFIYYNERQMEHTVQSDAGAMIRDGIKSIAKQGVCEETEWPYDIAKFAEQPPAPAYADAKANLAIQYQRLARAVDVMRGCLASGYPFTLGISVYDSFESQDVAQSGIVPMPGPHESLLGGHAVLAVGYDHPHQRFIVRNSWGTRWGMRGYCTIPYAYVTNDNLSDDFWTVRRVE
jgi:C1A family cysteine protease